MLKFKIEEQSPHNSILKFTSLGFKEQMGCISEWVFQLMKLEESNQLLVDYIQNEAEESEDVSELIIAYKENIEVICRKKKHLASCRQALEESLGILDTDLELLFYQAEKVSIPSLTSIQSFDQIK